jgi:hypothetical protein
MAATSLSDKPLNAMQSSKEIMTPPLIYRVVPFPYSTTKFGKNLSANSADDSSLSMLRPCVSKGFPQLKQRHMYTAPSPMVSDHSGCPTAAPQCGHDCEFSMGSGRSMPTPFLYFYDSFRDWALIKVKMTSRFWR